MIAEGKILVCGDFAEICQKDAEGGWAVTPESLRASPIIALAYFSGIVDDLGPAGRPMVKGVCPDVSEIAALAYSRHSKLEENADNGSSSSLQIRISEANDIARKALGIIESLKTVDCGGLYEGNMQGYPALRSLIQAYASWGLAWGRLRYVEQNMD